MIKKTLTILSCLFLGWSSHAQTTFTEDFSPIHTWHQVGAGIAVSGSKASYSNCADGQSNRIHTTHGLTLTDNWALDIDFQFKAVGLNGPGHYIASVTAGNLDPVSSNTPFIATNQDAIAMMFYSNDNSNLPGSFDLVGTSKNNDGPWNHSTGILLTLGTTYYLRLERLDATHARISAFSDPARTTHIANSPQCFTLSTGITNHLTTIQHGNSCWGGPNRKLTGWIDNTRLTNYTTNELISGNQEICWGTGNPAAFTSTATSNNPGTAYQWQNSINGGITWSDITSATSITYDSPAGITQNTLYRRITTHASLCGDQHVSNTVSLTVTNCSNAACDFSTDFSSDTNWTTVGTGIDITNGAFAYNNCIDGSSNRMFTNHNVPLTNSWRLDFDFHYTANGDGGPGHHLASLTAGTLDPTADFNAGNVMTTTNQDMISAMFFSTDHSSVANTFRLVGCSKNDNNPWILSSDNIRLTRNVPYFLTLERLDQTHGRISAFSDAARTIHVTGSPQCFNIDQNVTNNLSILQHGNTSWGGTDRSLTGVIDNDCLANLSFSGGVITGEQYVLCGSTAPITSVSSASGPNSSYTFTYVWEQSTNNSTWTGVTISPTGFSFTPDPIYTTTYYRRRAVGPCGMTLISNTLTRNVILDAPLNSEFSLDVDCQSGQPNFTVEAIPIISSGTNFLGTWVITDTTASTPADTLSTTNCSPCNFSGYTFIQGHVYQITYIVKDLCTGIGSTVHTVTCSAGMILQDGKETESKASVNSFIHPNPTRGIVTVALKDGNAKQISIFNTQGVLIQSVTVSDKTMRHLIDLSEQPSGLYLVTVRSEAGLMTHKLVKE